MSTNGEDVEREETNSRTFPNFGFPSCRAILVLLSFLGFVNVYCLRVNLSVALVDMVNSSASEKTNYNHSHVDDLCVANDSSSDLHHKAGEFNWDSQLQGLILAAFFYGYIVTQIPGGWLAERYGGKILLGGGILCTSVLTLLTPWAARWKVEALIAVRVLEGIGEGVTFPAMHAMLAKWAPVYERSRMVTLVYAGAQLGTVIGMPISGILCQYGFAGGWPSVFYVFGAAGCLWFIAWLFLCYDTPAKHPRISMAEREYIESNIGKQKRMPTPWRKILISPPVWACAAAHFANNWGFYTLLTCLPMYMKDVLKYDIAKNGSLSGMPYLANWIVMTLGGQVADFLRMRHYLTTRSTRKLFNVLGLLLPGVFLIAAGFTGCNYSAAVGLVIVAVGTSGLAMSGYGVNHLDLSPGHAGTLMGLTNCLATIPGFVGPQIVGALTYYEATRLQWQKVFYIAMGVYGWGALVYLLLGSGEQQKWAEEEPKDVSDESQNLLSDTTEDN